MQRNDSVNTQDLRFPEEVKAQQANQEESAGNLEGLGHEK